MTGPYTAALLRAYENERQQIFDRGRVVATTPEEITELGRWLGVFPTPSGRTLCTRTYLSLLPAEE